MSDPPDEGATSEEAQFVQQLLRGDAEAGHRFVREHYPSIYLYLLYLTGRPELSEDLTQETFLQAWRGLDRFVARAPLRAWLHRIAHREFLQALRSQRVQASLEEIPEVAEPRTAEVAEAVELREVIRKLPVEEGEVVVLHYLQGYNCEEIAQIVQAQVTTVKYRLLTARTHLQRELGEGDLPYLNEPGVVMRGWAWLPLEEMSALEARLGAPTRSVGPGGARGTRKEDPMERREFLRHAAAGAVGLMLPEKEVVDGRLTRKVTLAFKATALSDVCERLRSETGIHLVAGNSVADKKVTLFCQKLPLRDVMRQLSRPFGYAWLRSGAPSSSPNAGGEQRGYRYELAQDLRSQLMEKELRNRDRNAALLALEGEIERYRPYGGLSPDEARARAETAPPAEKKLLEKLAGLGWGPFQMYFRLAPRDLAALRAGEELEFSEEPNPGERRLPAEVGRGVLQSLRNWRVVRRDDGHLVFGPMDVVGRDGVPATQSAEARAGVTLKLEQSELGSLALEGLSFCFGTPPHNQFWFSRVGDPPYAIGRSREVLEPRNAPPLEQGWGLAPIPHHQLLQRPDQGGSQSAALSLVSLTAAARGAHTG